MDGEGTRSQDSRSYRHISVPKVASSEPVLAITAASSEAVELVDDHVNAASLLT